MKTKTTKLNMVLIFAAAVALLVAGCAGMESGNTTSLLTAAGFRARTPQTPKQQQIYAALPPYQVERATIKGKGVFYVYKDEKAGLAYVGREPEYQRYQQLAIQQQIAQERYMAAQMEADAAWQRVRQLDPQSYALLETEVREQSDGPREGDPLLQLFALHQQRAAMVSRWLMVELPGLPIGGWPGAMNGMAQLMMDR